MIEPEVAAVDWLAGESGDEVAASVSVSLLQGCQRRRQYRNRFGYKVTDLELKVGSVVEFLKDTVSCKVADSDVVESVCKVTNLDVVGDALKVKETVSAGGDGTAHGTGGRRDLDLGRGGGDLDPGPRSWTWWR